MHISLLSRRDQILTLALSLIFFWISLGFGSNISDIRYWINSTWTTLYLEWGYIALFSLLGGVKLFKTIWHKHSFWVKLSILWAIIVLFSTILSPFYRWDNPLVLMRLAETFTHPLFFLSIWASIRFSYIRVKWVYAAIILATAIAIGAITLFAYLHPETTQFHSTVYIRSDDLIINTLIRRLGYQLDVAIAILLPLLLLKPYKKYCAILIFIFLAYLLWLGGRASILGVISAVAVWFWIERKSPEIKKILGVLLGLPLILILLSYIGLLSPGFFLNMFSRTLHASSLNYLTGGRLDVWELLFMQLHNHWILGTGPQSYFFYPHRGGMVIHAHNFLLQFLGEWGLLGAAIALFILFNGFHYGWKIDPLFTKETRAFHLGSALVLISLTVTGLFGGVFYFSQTCAYLALFFAIWSAKLIQDNPMS